MLRVPRHIGEVQCRSRRLLARVDGPTPPDGHADDEANGGTELHNAGRLEEVRGKKENG